MKIGNVTFVTFAVIVTVINISVTVLANPANFRPATSQPVTSRSPSRVSQPTTSNLTTSLEAASQLMALRPAMSQQTTRAQPSASHLIKLEPMTSRLIKLEPMTSRLIKLEPMTSFQRRERSSPRRSTTLPRISQGRKISSNVITSCSVPPTTRLEHF